MTHAYIQAIGTAHAGQSVNNLDQGRELGVPDGFVETKIGVQTLPERSTGEMGVDLAHRAVLDLQERDPVALEEVDLLVYVSQNPDYGGLPHNAAILHGRLRLPQTVACFDVGLGCSGFVYGLEIVSTMIASGRYRRALLITCDPYRHALVPGDKNTRLLFGDWACATLVGTRGNWRIGPCDLRTKGADHTALIRTDDGISMNGRAVYNFARRDVSAAVRDFCARFVGDIAEVGLFLMHQGSKAVVEELRKQLDVPPARMPLDIEVTGNAVSSSIPLLMSRHADTSAQVIVACGFGVGLSIGTVALYKESEHES